TRGGHGDFHDVGCVSGGLPDAPRIPRDDSQSGRHCRLNLSANAQFVTVAERLIAFNTVSRNSNLELIGAAKDALGSAGATTRFTYDRDFSKANLFATIGPEQDGGLVLSGHTDVVPVDGQEWSSDPFTPVIREGQLYGRGAADMKGFLAVALALAPEFAALDLRRPIHFALS